MHVAEVPEIATLPLVPHVEIWDPLALKVTVPVFPLFTVAVIVIAVLASRGDEGETAIETPLASLVMVNEVFLLAR